MAAQAWLEEDSKIAGQRVRTGIKMADPAINLLPKRMSIGIGGHFGTSFSVELDGVESITYRRTKRREKDPWEIGSSEEWETKSEPVTPTQERWAAFRTALDRLNVWSWETVESKKLACYISDLNGGCAASSGMLGAFR
jgi:hypothetical protein